MLKLSMSYLYYFFTIIINISEECVVTLGVDELREESKLPTQFYCTFFEIFSNLYNFLQSFTENLKAFEIFFAEPQRILKEKISLDFYLHGVIKNESIRKLILKIVTKSYQLPHLFASNYPPNFPSFSRCSAIFLH